MTLYEILYAAKTGGEVSDTDLRRAVVALDALETLTGFAVRKDQSANLARFERLKRALDKDPLDWLGADHDPMDPSVQARHRRSAAAIGGWFDREDR